MPYAIRNKDGELIGISKHPSDSTSGQIANDDPGLIQMRTDRRDKKRIESAIHRQMRVSAILQMKADGKIDADYPVPNVPNVMRQGVVTP